MLYIRSCNIVIQIWQFHPYFGKFWSWFWLLHPFFVCFGSKDMVPSHYFWCNLVVNCQKNSLIDQFGATPGKS
jgi:hypothetical protein